MKADADRPLICLFAKLRNEIVREGDVYRMLRNAEHYCDAAVVCDDASEDGTAREVALWLTRQAARTGVANHWRMIQVPAGEQDFRRELAWKQRMLEAVHEIRPHWVLWMDGDEVFDAEGTANLREWSAHALGRAERAWRFHYTQFWRNTAWARTDASFDDGSFLKLWRYSPDLAFAVQEGTHHAQFPRQVHEALAMGLVGAGPFEQLHYGNFGKSLVWKCLDGSMSIETEEHGRLPIQEISRRDLTPRIKCFDAGTGEIMWGRVVARNVERKRLREWVRFHGAFGGSWSLIVTPDHRVWSDFGMVEADKLGVGDRLYVESPRLSPDQWQVVLGTLLGDGSIARTTLTSSPLLSVTHGPKQLTYLTWKVAALRNLAPSITLRRDGAQQFSIRRPVLEAVYGLCRPQGGRKRISWEWLGRLEALGLAVWFMDDGNVRIKRNCDGSRGSLGFDLNLTVSGDDEEIELIARYFATRWTLRPTIRAVKGKRCYRVLFWSAESRRLAEILSPYVAVSREGKRWVAGSVDVGTDGVVPVPIVRCDRFLARRSAYDLTVETHHTILANRVAVSNCIQYWGGLGGVDRHLVFPLATYRPVHQSAIPPGAESVVGAPPQPFTDREVELVRAMRDLRRLDGWFTVVVPAYNRAATLPRALDSLLAQTYESWVALVLDDGSTDDTPQVMRRYQDRDPRIFYARYPDNRGGVVMNELGMGLACSMTEYWTRLGSDDWFGRDKLAYDAAALSQFEAVYGSYVVVRDGKFAEACNPPREPAVNRQALLTSGFVASWANVAVRTSVLRAIRQRYRGFCDPRLRNMEDFLVNARIARETAGFVWRGRVDGALVVNPPAEVIAKVIGPRGFGASEVEAVWTASAAGASGNVLQYMKDENLTRTLILQENLKYGAA